MYYVQWKSLITFGFGVWSFFYITDILGESTWKRYSIHLNEILEGHYALMMQMNSMSKQEEQKEKLNWSLLIWNICAFFCSLIFFTVVRSLSWIVWKMNQNILTGFAKNLKQTKVEVTSPSRSNVKIETSQETVENCRMIFKNQQFTESNNQTNIILAQQYAQLNKQLEATRKDNDELIQELQIKQKEFALIKQQLDEHKLETVFMKEKLAKTSNTLKANMKYKEFANSNQEVIIRKVQTLELHLQEVCRDRDGLKSKLASKEKDVAKLEEQLKYYQDQEITTRTEEQVPERDDNPKIEEPLVDSEVTEEGELGYNKFHKRIIDLQNSIRDHGGYERLQQKTISSKFDSNSKLSFDFDESSLDTSNDFQDDRSNITMSSTPDPNMVKQNFINYHAYKAHLFRPRIMLDNITERAFSATDTTTASSSDDNNSTSTSCPPRRIISDTIEFQNLLKNLNSTSSFACK